MEFTRYEITYTEVEVWGNGSWFEAQHQTDDGVWITRKAWLPESKASIINEIIAAFGD